MIRPPEKSAARSTTYPHYLAAPKQEPQRQSAAHTQRRGPGASLSTFCASKQVMDEASMEQARLEHLLQTKRSSMSASSSVDGGEPDVLALAPLLISRSIHKPTWPLAAPANRADPATTCLSPANETSDSTQHLRLCLQMHMKRAAAEALLTSSALAASRSPSACQSWCSMPLRSTHINHALWCVSRTIPLTLAGDLLRLKLICSPLAPCRGACCARR